MSFSITPSPTALKTVTPNLMPFRVAYNGPAPMSTYFHPKEVESTEESTGESSTDSNYFGKLKRRFIARFRGRTVQGQDIPLPEGYAGAVLQHTSAPPKQRKNVVGGKSNRGKRTRGAPVEEETEEMEEEVDDEDVRYLKAAAQFSTLRVWNADYPLNEDEDVYVRGMREWIVAAAEMSAECV
ncbi:ribonuclease H1 small subunit [Sistotremastrum niveocremeum HHB9708]|uniref:Ribonuclease H1 small subunit n=1 Tax=Sistotremastrum niveocremeum HHB9708 TaxID=1314777 RepID=A0A164W1Z1_9AGAM|nr:ribonuclease H1 small subunit [Sistotremastrum niveocremeum HHB9708]